MEDDEEDHHIKDSNSQSPEKKKEEKTDYKKSPEKKETKIEFNHEEHGSSLEQTANETRTADYNTAGDYILRQKPKNKETYGFEEEEENETSFEEEPVDLKSHYILDIGPNFESLLQIEQEIYNKKELIEMYQEPKPKPGEFDWDDE